MSRPQGSYVSANTSSRIHPARQHPHGYAELERIWVLRMALTVTDVEMLLSLNV